MKKKPTSAKKHKHLRRARRTDWDKSRQDMEAREEIADKAADKYLEELINVNSRA